MALRVYLPGLKKDPKSGKGFFYQRLAPALREMGVEVVDDLGSSHDVSLCNVHLKKANSKRRVVRLDGIYHNTKQPYKKMNKKIARSLHRADGVVYQSAFAKKMCDEYLGKFSGKSAVIWNGMDQKYWETVSPAKSNFRYNFLTASRWRPHKRLREIIGSFLLAEIPDSCLYIAGDLSKSGISSKRIRKICTAHPNVINLGLLKQKKLATYMKLADAFLHLCWFDACPNSVVEAISSGTPVICNNTGGTPELVQVAGGYICEVDSSYDLQPVDLYHPPKIDKNKIAQALRDSIGKNITIDNLCVSIQKVAQQYAHFFWKIL